MVCESGGTLILDGAIDAVAVAEDHSRAAEESSIAAGFFPLQERVMKTIASHTTRVPFP